MIYSYTKYTAPDYKLVNLSIAVPIYVDVSTVDFCSPDFFVKHPFGNIRHNTLFYAFSMRFSGSVLFTDIFIG